MRAAVRFTAMVLAVLLVAVAAALPATAAKEIEWKHLLPDLPPIKNPLARLTVEQRFDIETILWSRTLTEQEKRLEENQQGLKDVVIFERQFAAAGLSVERLLAGYQRWIAAAKKRNNIVNRGLAGKQIRLAGYLLPLEFSDQGVSDFLLVAYVGACIHVPPPPPNQIVFVQLAKRLLVRDLFTPVWVTGRLRTKATSKALTLVDGTADISVGYHINAGSVEVYTE